MTRVASASRARSLVFALTSACVTCVACVSIASASACVDGDEGVPPSIGHLPATEGEPSSSGAGEGEGAVVGEGEGDATDVPLCIARIQSVNGVDVDPAVPLTIGPSDDVVVALDHSHAAAGHTLATFHWTLVGAPAGSGAALASPDTVETGFLTNGAAGVRVPGVYTIEGAVADERGVASSNGCGLTFQVEAFAIDASLTWTSPNNALDLHVTKVDASGGACIADVDGEAPAGFFARTCDTAADDCDRESCAPSPPDWDGDGVVGSGGDPELLQLGETGPDVVRVLAPIAGDYLVSVEERASSSSSPDSASVQLFLDGTLGGAWQLDTHVGSFAEVALAHVDAQGAVCVEDLTDGNAHDQCN